MRIFHIATVADWSAVPSGGDYTTSTLDRSLEEVGFIHAAHRDQVAGVFRQFYRGYRRPLVLLSIDTERLAAPWREEQVGDQRFPHIFGPLNRTAVVDVQPLNSRGGTMSMLQLFLGEVFRRIAAAFAVMMLAVGGVALGRSTGAAWGPFVGGLAGIVVGIFVWWAISRWRSDDRGR